jgi:oligopeptide transport system ATP-binding protein
MKPLLEVQNLTKCYGNIKALNGVSFTLQKSQTLALVGESGSGKSTLGKAILHLTKPTSGKIIFEGEEINLFPKVLRKEMQMVFQNPYASLNPKMNMEQILREPLIIHSIPDQPSRVLELLDQVHLPSTFLKRYPHELSGGQRQRIAIARALASKPKLVICDEPVSALDTHTQEQIIDLLQNLKKQLGIAYLFITHDLSLAQEIADNVCVLYAGKIIESAPAKTLFTTPAHPYTKALLSAIPQENQPTIILQGDPPNPSNLPTGCSFHPRCPFALPTCQKGDYPLQLISTSHFSACPFSN